MPDIPSTDLVGDADAGRGTKVALFLNHDDNPVT